MTQTVYGRDSKLGFGKHRTRTLRWIAQNDPSYLAWLKRENVVDVIHQQDRRWYEGTAASIHSNSALRQPYSKRRTSDRHPFDQDRSERDSGDGFDMMDMPCEEDLVGHYPGDA